MKPLSIVNEYGNFDLANNSLQKRYVHVSGLRLQPLCRSLNIRFCEAVVGFRPYSGGRYSPIKNGVIVAAANDRKLKEAIGKRQVRSDNTRRREEAKKVRREIELEQSIFRLSRSEVISVGCQSLFKLNRLAKLRACEEVQDQIYGLKNQWIGILYKAGLCDRCESHIIPVRTPRRFSVFSDRVDSSGDFWDLDDDTEMDPVPSRLEFIVFSFSIGEIQYTWHQPQDEIEFEYQLTNNQPVEFVPGRPQAEMIAWDEINTLLTKLHTCVQRLTVL